MLPDTFHPPAPGPAQLIQAQSDTQAVLTWLAEHADKPATLAGYRKEAERLLLWLNQRRQTLAQMKREDVQDYRRFLASPHPAEQWIGPARPRSHPQWKPFTRPLSPQSVNHSLTVLGAMFSYLNDAGYLNGNPFKLLRRRGGKTQRQEVERFLDAACWQHLQDTLDALPRDTDKEIRHAERARWLFTLLYLTGARRAEAAAARASDLAKRHGNWWWNVLGKGDVAARIPLSDELMAALARYRRSLGLPAEPASGDDTPLVCRIGAKGRMAPLSDKAIYLICKEIFAQALHSAPSEELKNQLRRASTHWLRHTAASHQLEAGVPLLLVSQNLRHASIQTTRRYLHSEEDARHQASQLHKLRRRDK
ncbi:tyrosine-type recombinase/integrase [Chromobacterium phragmitis]|uniref:tyrosine-type recombinase/integrase n=1 Tax=Chromobacterium amazonense TaxID=1382803 RepID=UPI0021B72474|nr:site-specific integrase [Chromobacterium amazonense]MBM2883824.1 tyrosine-type recombinase/integrase [Chromobacterium amazonense]